MARFQHCKEYIFAWPRKARREWVAGGKDAGQGAWGMGQVHIDANEFHISDKMS